MKKITLILLLSPFFLVAQSKEGTIDYDFILQFNFDGEMKDNPQLKNMLPKERKLKSRLYFTENETMYKNLDDDEKDEFSSEEGNTRMVFKMPTPDNKVYCNLKNNLKVERRDFLGKFFLISDKIKKTSWKLTGEVKKIDKYVCQKATLKKDEEEIVAWFTPEIPISSGPMGYGQLPGMILEVNINDGARVYRASNINLGEVDKSKIVKPSKGKKVNREQYEKIVDAKMEEMGGVRRGNGVRMLISTDGGDPNN